LEKASALGHVFAARELAGMLLSGHCGPAKIPKGLMLFVRSFCMLIRVARKESLSSEKLI
jgi:hypothetical protein